MIGATSHHSQLATRGLERAKETTIRDSAVDCFESLFLAKSIKAAWLTESKAEERTGDRQ